MSFVIDIDQSQFVEEVIKDQRNYLFWLILGPHGVALVSSLLQF